MASAARLFPFLILLLLAATGAARAADLENGERRTQICLNCHETAPDENGIGPTLFKIINRRAGSMAGYNYSRAMGSLTYRWTRARLSAYIANPRVAVPGTKEIFAGYRNADDRRDVIAYLESIAGVTDLPATARFLPGPTVRETGTEVATRIDGVLVKAQGFVAECRSAGQAAVFGPLPTSDGLKDMQVFGADPAGLDVYGLGILAQSTRSPRVRLAGSDFAAAPRFGLDNSRYATGNTGKAKFDFVQLTFDRPVFVEDVVLRGVRRQDTDAWYTTHDADPDWTAGFRTALASGQPAYSGGQVGVVTRSLPVYRAAIRVLTIGAVPTCRLGPLYPADLTPDQFTVQSVSFSVL